MPACPIHQRLEAAGCRLSWNGKDLCFSVEYGKLHWRSRTTPSTGLILIRAGKEIPVDLNRAARKTFARYDTGAQAGIRCRLAGFAALPASVNVNMHLNLGIEKNSGDLYVAIHADIAGARFRHLKWPGPLLPADGSRVESVFPFMQGAYIPARWPFEVPEREYPCNSRSFTMPWWAQAAHGSGFLTLLLTDTDAGAVLAHDPAGTTSISPLWLDQLDAFAYSRRLVYRRIKNFSPVRGAKMYRDEVVAQNRFVHLADKIRISPKVADLIGRPVVSAGATAHIHPQSAYYNQTDKSKNHRCTPFGNTAERLRHLKQRGLDRAYVHLDGWGVQGYDSHHPDYLPPSREAGGWKGLKALADTCHDIGYLLALHDQYRDYYRNAPSFDADHATHRANGSIPEHSAWFGGPQSILCARLAPAYVSRNHRRLRAHGIQVDGAYLDVFSIVEPDQCFHPYHRMSRGDCLHDRARCLNIIRELEGIASSEEPVDFFIPHLHLVHHAPYATQRWMIGMPGPEALPVIGVPLISLVYHDCLIIPWTAGTAPGGWGIPSDETGAAHCALNAGMPYIDLDADQREIGRILAFCRLQRRLAFVEMTDHEFLSADRKKQRAGFADGTVVNVNLASGEWKVSASGRCHSHFDLRGLPGGFALPENDAK